MNSEFDIIKYISGLVSYPLDRSVLERIAIDRGVLDIYNYVDLSLRDRELLRADLLYEICLGAETSASISVADGAFKKSIGGYSINKKNALYNELFAIYEKYNDDKLRLLKPSTISWIQEI